MILARRKAGDRIRLTAPPKSTSYLPDNKKERLRLQFRREILFAWAGFGPWRRSFGFGSSWFRDRFLEHSVASHVSCAIDSSNGHGRDRIGGCGRKAAPVDYLQVPSILFLRADH